MAPKEQIINRTPFKKQASVISTILSTNPMLGDDDKASLNETVGVLTWMNELQKHWADGGDGIPESIKKQLFENRAAQRLVTQSSPG